MLPVGAAGGGGAGGRAGLVGGRGRGGAGGAGGHGEEPVRPGAGPAGGAARAPATEEAMTRPDGPAPRWGVAVLAELDAGALSVARAAGSGPRPRRTRRRSRCWARWPRPGPSWPHCRPRAAARQHRTLGGRGAGGGRHQPGVRAAAPGGTPVPACARCPPPPRDPQLAPPSGRARPATPPDGSAHPRRAARCSSSSCWPPGCSAGRARTRRPRTGSSWSPPAAPRSATPTSAPLADPVRRAGCLRAVAAPGVDPDAALLGGRRVELARGPALLLVCPTGERGVFDVVVVDPDCGPAGGTLLAARPRDRPVNRARPGTECRLLGSC